MFSIDTMLCRASASNRQLGIIRTGEPWDPFTVIDPVDIHHRRCDACREPGRPT